MTVKTIGLVLETKEDAVKEGADLDHLYHWREPEEIEAIVAAIKSLGFTPVILGDPAALCRLPEIPPVDFILNLSVGFRHRFRLALGPGLYHLMGIPYSGADPYPKMVSQNKHLMKAFWDKQGISTPEWIFLGLDDELPAAGLPSFPLVVKPAHEGSSIGLDSRSVVRTDLALQEQIDRLRRKLGMPLIIERFIAGREFKVGIIGHDKPAFLGIIEDLTAAGDALGDRLLTFDSKIAGSFGKAAREIDQPEFAGLKEDCLRIYKWFLPMDYGTFDVRLDDRGRHYFLEFNADATLHPRRTLGQCCALHGLDFSGMIGAILRTSFTRWGLAWK